MEDRVLSTIKEYNLINEKDNIVVGVSGGPDSMALLYLLLYAKKHIDFNIIVAHVNHGVRGEEALLDELFVKRKSIELGLEFYSISADMVEFAKKNRISEEEAGREIRYSFFRSLLKPYSNGKIAVAHNMNDQAETLIMRIIRGTGIDGLNGMDYILGDIIRPVLNITRAEIEKYIEDNHIETVLDKTNLMPIYTRNKVRLELIPYIEEHFNPNLIKSLWRLSQTSRSDSLFLKKHTEEEYLKILICEEKEKVSIDREGFIRLDLSIQKRMIILMITKILGVFQGFGEQHIITIRELFIFGETGKILNLPNGIISKVDYSKLTIQQINKNITKPFVYDLVMGYNHFSELSYGLELTVSNIKDIDLNYKSSNTKYFDNDKIKGTLSIRNRRDGDRFVPYGMKGSKKLKDFFIDLKVSREKRDEIPLIVDEENIIWVIGHRISELYKLTKNTKNVLIVKYISFEEDKDERRN